MQSRDVGVCCHYIPKVYHPELNPTAPLLILKIRTCSNIGQANLVSFETFNEQIHFKSLLEKLPVTLRIQIQISNIITRAHKTLLDLGLVSMTPQQERTMDALLKGFSTELDSLESLAPSSRDQSSRCDSIC